MLFVGLRKKKVFNFKFSVHAFVFFLKLEVRFYIAIDALTKGTWLVCVSSWDGIV